MYIPFPHEVTQKAAKDYEFAGAVAETLNEILPSVERQTLYFKIGYPIMWVSFLAVSCYMSKAVSWWSGYGLLVFLTLSSHLLFRWAYNSAMRESDAVQKVHAYYVFHVIRTGFVCVFTIAAIGSLVSVASLVHSLTPLMEKRDQPAAVQPAD